MLLFAALGCVLAAVLLYILLANTWGLPAETAEIALGEPLP